MKSAALTVACLAAALFPAACRKPSRPNVLLLIVDNVRADRLGGGGYVRPVLPRLSRFAQDGLVFENAFTPIPISLPSYASILTGRYPQQHGMLRNRGSLPEGVPTLAGVLRENGYRTGAVFSCALTNRGTGLGRGFDAFLENWGISDKIRAGAPGGLWEIKGLAEDAVRLALEWLDGAGEGPFFLAVAFYDAHAPYVEMEGFRDLFDPRDPALAAYIRERYDRMPEPPWKLTTITYYDRSLAYLDAQAGALLDRLRERGRLDNTLVVVVSDHGDGLYQHGDYWSHGEQLYDEAIRVPLIVRLPEGRRGRVPEMVETVDIAPTVLDLLGIPLPPGLDGRSLLPLARGEGGGRDRVFAMSALEDASGRPLRLCAVRTPECKLICAPAGPDRFWRLSEDPYELGDGRLPEDPEGRRLAADLRGRGLAWYQARRIEAARPAPVDPGAARALKAFGYDL